MSFVNRPVVYLAFAHESKKNKGIKVLKSLHENLAETFDRFVTQSCDPVLDLQREGKDGLPYAFEVLSAELQYPHLSVIHIASEPSGETPLHFNALAGKRKELDLDNLFLDHLKDLKLIIIDGGATSDLVEKLLFAGAPAVIGLNYIGENPSAVSFIQKFYHRLIQGNPLQTAFECAIEAEEEKFTLQVIASDPYEYWETKEKEDPHAPFAWGLYYLSANSSALSWQIVDPAEVIENIPEEPEVIDEIADTKYEQAYKQQEEQEYEPQDEQEIELVEETPFVPEEAELVASEETVEDKSFFDLMDAEALIEASSSVELESEDALIIPTPLFFQARPGGFGADSDNFAQVRFAETGAISELAKIWKRGKSAIESSLIEEEETPIREEVISPEETQVSTTGKELQLYHQETPQPEPEKKQEQMPEAEPVYEYAEENRSHSYDYDRTYNTENRSTRPTAKIRFPNWRNYAGISAGAIGALTGIFFIFNLISFNSKNKEITYLNAFQSVENYNVLILPFKPYPGCKAEDAYDEIAVRDRLNTLEESNELNIKAVFIDEAACPGNSEEARSMGEVYNADLVIWGNYPKFEEDSNRIHIHYVALSNSQDDLSFHPGDLGKQAFSDIYELQEGILSGSVDDMVYWVLGSIYLQNENYQVSLGYLQQISGNGTAEYGLINHMMAKCYHGLSMYDDVLNQYNQAIAANSQDANAYHSRGRLFQRLHQNDQALADYAEAIRINPKHLKAHYNRKILLDDEVDGGFYFDQAEINSELIAAGETTDSPESVPTVLSIEKPEFEIPRNEPELAKGNIQIINNPVAAEEKTESLSSMSNRAYQYEKEGKIKEAIAIYSAIVIAYPKDAGAFHKRGILYEKTGAFSKATADYSNAIQLDPRNIAYYNSRAYLFDRQRMFYKAIDDYTMLIKLNPDDVNGYIYRGKAYQYVRKNPEALADFQEVIRRNPLDATGYYFRGKLYGELNQPDNALSDFAKAIAINPGYGSAYRDRAEMYYDRKRYDKALSDYDKVLELNPHDAKVYAIRADIHMKMGNPEKAEADLRQAISIDPESTSYQQRLRELTSN
ncbi:MAG: tetratricopeptide repeat protein [Bacteroidia bacterium]